MDRPADSQAPPKDDASVSEPAKVVPPSYRTLYLILYNALSATLWSAVLGRVLLIVAFFGSRNTFAGAGELTKWTQTLAGLEVLHAALGIVRAPLLTTVMQVASRFLLVWLIVYPFPTIAVLPAYSRMLVAWSVTEVIRYSYFALQLAYGHVPRAVLWLRYNTFFVLYPLGIGSECWLIYRATWPAARLDLGLEWALYAILLIYIPGSYILFTHMMAQRRKVLRAQSAGKKEQ